MYFLLQIMQESSQKFTSKAWILMDYQKSIYLRGENVNLKAEFASITKMYTFYACLIINQLLNVQIDKIYIKILDFNNQGTSANLSIGSYIKLKDLYYGMMLPSGNDAASNLAFYYGHWLDKKESFPNFTWTKYKKEDLSSKLKHHKLLTQKFIHFINQNIIKKQLLHKNTHFQNPHGLSDKFQVSTAWELAQASIHFMKRYKLFRDVVKQKFFKGEYLNQLDKGESQSQNQYQGQFSWQNTNKLLFCNEMAKVQCFNFYGIKTGHTITARNCLSSVVNINVKNRQYNFVIVVLGCQTIEGRFSQTKKILTDYEAHLKQLQL